jgi:hypothetical protein
VINVKSYGEDHAETARSFRTLAALLQATNRLGEAETLMERALATDEKSYGPNHPNVALDLNNLAQLLKATNRLAEAEPLMRRARSIFEASLGPGHPHSNGAQQPRRAAGRARQGRVSEAGLLPPVIAPVLTMLVTIPAFETPMPPSWPPKPAFPPVIVPALASDVIAEPVLEFETPAPPTTPKSTPPAIVPPALLVSAVMTEALATPAPPIPSPLAPPIIPLLLSAVIVPEFETPAPPVPTAEPPIKAPPSALLRDTIVALAAFDTPAWPFTPPPPLTVPLLVSAVVVVAFSTAGADVAALIAPLFISAVMEQVDA